MTVVNTIKSDPGSYLQLGLVEINHYASRGIQLDVQRMSAHKHSDDNRYGDRDSHRYTVTTILGREGKELITMESRLWMDRELCCATSAIPVDAHIDLEYDDKGDRTGFMKIRLDMDNDHKWYVRMPESLFLRCRPWYYTRTKVMSPLVISFSSRLLFPLVKMLNNPEAFRKKHFPEYPIEQFNELCGKAKDRINRYTMTSYLGIIRKARVRMLSLEELAAKYRVAKEDRALASYIEDKEGD